MKKGSEASTRFHGRLLDAGRAGILAVALSASAPALAEEVFSGEARTAALETLWENAWMVVEEQLDVDPSVWEADNAPRADDSSVVFLMANYSDGGFKTGTGTVIRGDDGLNRVLTAGHVTPEVAMTDCGPAQLVEIMAFDIDGRPIANLELVMSGYDDRKDLLRKTVEARVIMDDVAVLEPYFFTDDAAYRTWNDMGVGIAEEIPDGILVASGGPDSLIFNAGVSGASLRNEAGEVFGIISYSYGGYDAENPERGSTYLEKVARQLDADDPWFISDRIEETTEFLDNMDSPARRPGAVGVGAPILQREILEALHIGGVTPARPGAGIEGRIVGFPDYELRMEDAKIVSLAAYPVEHRISPQTLTRNESNLGEGVSIGPLDPVTIVDGAIRLSEITITVEDEGPAAGEGH